MGRILGPAQKNGGPAHIEPHLMGLAAHVVGRAGQGGDV